MRLNASLVFIQKTYETDRVGRPLASQIVSLVEALLHAKKSWKDEGEEDLGSGELLNLLLKDQRDHGDVDSSVAPGTCAWVLWGDAGGVFEPYLREVEVVRAQMRFGVWERNQQSPFQVTLKTVGGKTFEMNQSCPNLFWDRGKANQGLVETFLRWSETTEEDYLRSIEDAKRRLLKLQESWDLRRRDLEEKKKKLTEGDLEQFLR